MKLIQTIALSALTLLFVSPSVTGQQPTRCGDEGAWTPINFQYGDPPLTGYIQAPLLLTDGRVMVQFTGAPSGGLVGYPYQDWYALTPNPNPSLPGGPYANGTWSELASLYNVWTNPQYGPYAFASAVLGDGNVIVQGGELNPAQGPGDIQTPLGAIYNPLENSWSQLCPPLGCPPNGWSNIGDAQSVVLPNGTYMVAACGSDDYSPCHTQPLPYEQAIWNDSGQTWTVLNYPGNGKSDRNAEEGYVLLPGGYVLTIDTGSGSDSYELFDSNTQVWSYSTNMYGLHLFGWYPGAGDIAPAILLPDKTVFAEGTITGIGPPSPQPASFGVYDSTTQMWEQDLFGTFPIETGSGCLNPDGSCPEGGGDESAVLLPDGNVFLTAHDQYQSYYFYEYQPVYQTTGPGLCWITNAPGSLNPSNGAVVKMLLLPTGQVLLTENSPNISRGNPLFYIYTPGSSAFQQGWAPTVFKINNGNPLEQGGTNYLVSGSQFNGLSQANMYGDDFQNATNYPLVQITDSTGAVYYARTHGHSTMGVATGTTPTFTHFDVPCQVATGTGELVVIANGIPSASNSVQITAGCGDAHLSPR